jgi:hypothetical protein
MDKVIDQNWLNNSMQPNAIALREAGATTNGAWRVLHRVTYVSRVPQEFQPVPDESQAPDITKPANLDANTFITRLVEKNIQKKNKIPTNVDISKAITLVIGDINKPDDAGILGTLLPWWESFITEAKIYASPANKTFTLLRENLLQYMVQKFESEACEKTA